MASTLTAGQEELTYFSFPIEKTEEDPATGTLYVYGKATTPEVDTDEQVVDPEWSAKSIATWFTTGPNVRVMHNPTAMPAGSGVKIEIDRDGDGAHWVKAAVDEPTAKLMVQRKHLRAFSVGIAKPLIVRDVTGKARGGIIKGGELAEISLVDRPANRSCYVEIAKSASDGSCEFTGKVFGADDFIAKGAPGNTPFGPADLAKLLEHRRIAEEREAEAVKALVAAESAVYKRDIDTATRRRLASQGRALPGNPPSYPVETHEDADNAVTLILSGHGDTGAASAMVRRIARKEGWQDILARLDGKKDGGKKKAAAPEGAPVTDDEAAKGAVAAPPATGMPPAVAKDDGGDEHEPVLHHDDGQDDDTDSDADANEKAVREQLLVKYGWTPEQLDALPADAITAIIAAEKTAMPDAMAGKKAKIPCPKCKAMCKPKARFCGKCGAPMTAEKASQPTPADDVTGHHADPAPEHREPDGPAIEALEHDAHLPTVPDASVKTAMRLRDLGVPVEAGRLHDLLCPAYDAASVKAAWPGADLSLVDEMAWQAKALEIAASAPLEEARKAAQVWEAARIVKSVPPDLAGDLMGEAHKAFRDANPGPGRGPVPGEIHAERYNRPLITDGHAAPSPDQGAPNRSPIHPQHIAASDFHRDLITSGHAADSPDNASPRPEAVPAPEVPGVPSRVFYSNTQRANARQAMSQMHDHIAMTFPDLCPMHQPGSGGMPPSHARPVPVGVGGPVPHGAAKNAPPLVEAPVEDAAAAKAARKAAKRERMQREMIDAIVKGLPGFDEIRRAGRFPGDGEGDAVKAATPPAPAPLAPAVAATVDPDVIEAVITKAQAPLLARLDEQDKVLDAIASQGDPGVTAYRGAALTKASAAPAGPLGISERAARVQDTFIHDRIDTARNSPDPQLRLQAMFDLMDMHGLTGAKST